MLLAVAGLGWWAWRVLPSRRKERAEIRVTRARLTARIARLGADIATLSPGDDSVARRQLAEAAERHATARALFDQTDTLEEASAVAATLADGDVLADQVRTRLRLPRRRRSAANPGKVAPRAELDRDASPSGDLWQTPVPVRPLPQRRWTVFVPLSIIALITAPVLYQVVSEERQRALGSAREATVNRWRAMVDYLAPVALAAVALFVGLLVLVSVVRRRHARRAELGTARTAADSAVSRVAAQLTRSTSGDGDAVGGMSSQYIALVGEFNDARSIEDFDRIVDQADRLTGHAIRAARRRSLRWAVLVKSVKARDDRLQRRLIWAAILLPLIVCVVSKLWSR
jgi:hypothetical protein